MLISLNVLYTTRFQHDSTAATYTVCSTCGWSGVSLLQSPTTGIECPIDHSREWNNEVVSRVSQNEYLRTTVHTPNDDDCDLWVCLVCGFVGCGRSHDFHIRQHFESHGHTYAMNTVNR